MNREVSAALSRMDIGKDVTKVWQRLDEYVMTDSQRECHKIEVEGGAIANRLDDAQVGLAEAVYRQEWNDEWAPILSLFSPGTRSGGLSGCRFEHPDEQSSGPMPSLRLRMNSLGIMWSRTARTSACWRLAGTACRRLRECSLRRDTGTSNGSSLPMQRRMWCMIW